MTEDGDFNVRVFADEEKRQPYRVFSFSPGMNIDRGQAKRLVRAHLETGRKLWDVTMATYTPGGDMIDMVIPFRDDEPEGV